MASKIQDERNVTPRQGALMGRGNQEHVSEGMLSRFFQGRLARQDTRRLVRHLLTSCPRCLEAAARASQRSGQDEPDLAGAAQVPSSYADVFLDLLRGREEETLRLARERLQGIGLLAELE